MCGYVGIFELGGGKKNIPLLKNLPALSLVKRRGPDQQNFYSNENLSLYHSRLVISSPSDEDQQPFLKKRDGRDDVLLYAGEIYNWRNLSPEAKGDTSALFDWFSQNKISGLKELRGDFSFFFKGEEMFLVRDHLGVKPLYYSLQKNNDSQFLVFSTNFKAVYSVLKQRNITLTKNLEAINQYRNFRYVLDPKASVFNEISQLPAGHFLKFSNHLKFELGQYWGLPEKEKEPFVQEEFQEVLDESIFLRVPEITEFGTFLSGGLDSGYLTHKTKDSSLYGGSFSLDVPGDENERVLLNEFLKDHNVPNFLYSFIFDDRKNSNLFEATDVPIGDSVLYLLHSLFEFSSEKAKVFLSGDGADEVFGGYIHHKVFYYGNIFRKIFPGISKTLILKLIESLPPSFFQTIFPYKGRLTDEGLKKLVNFLNSFKTPIDAYVQLVGLGSADGSELGSLKKKWEGLEKSEFHLKDILRFDLSYWGPNYSLSKIDFLGGFQGIEVRVPYYDHKLIEYVLKHDVPLINLRQDKILLRQVALKDNLKIGNAGKSPFRIDDSEISPELRGKGLLEGKRKVCQEHWNLWEDSLKSL